MFLCEYLMTVDNIFSLRMFVEGTWGGVLNELDLPRIPSGQLKKNNDKYLCCSCFTYLGKSSGNILPLQIRWRLLYVEMNV